MKKDLRLLFILPFFIFCFQNKTIAQCWNDGDFTTYYQESWGASSTGAGSNLQTHFNTVYASTLGVVEIGIPGSGGFSMQFSSPFAVFDYLPALGTPAALTADLLDPLTGNSGQFGGNVLALKLNIDFSDAGFLSGTAGIRFGDLVIYGLTSNTDLNGLTIRQFQDIVNTALGGGSTTDPIADLDAITADINNSFSAGTASTFAQQHLRKGWKSGDVYTFTQTQWKSDIMAPGVAGKLITDNFDGEYAGAFIIGTGYPSGTGFFAFFASASDLLAFFPQSGAISALGSDYLDPAFTSAGAFAGEVAALKLNVDFSDIGVLHGTSPAKFGNLTLCGLNTLPALNGIAVRDFLTEANTLLAGGSGTYTIADIYPVIQSLNASFENGTVSTFASQHLGSGTTCPASSWQNGDMITYTQSDWGAQVVVAQTATLVNNNFNTKYGGNFEIGIYPNGDPPYVAIFTTASTLLSFFPQISPINVFGSDYIDPGFTSAGAFAGESAALKLNIDFSDAGLITNNSGLKFGDLVIYNFTSSDNLIDNLTQTQADALNGKTIRQMFNEINTVIGGGTGTLGLTINQLYDIAFQLNLSFASGVSTFAQQHLIACYSGSSNTCPTANAINISTTVGSAVKFLLQGSDADNNTLTYSISQAPAHGTATIVGGDSILYTPASGYHGADQLKYKVSDGQCDAEATVNITVVVCPGGQGYWKNNSSAWPVSSLMLGTGSYTKSQLITILNTPVGSGNNADASLILADQLIPAKLSVANGSPDPGHLADSIAAADALIGASLIPMKVKPNTALGKKMTSLAAFLQSYNSGSLTNGCSQHAMITAAALITETVAPLPEDFVLENYPNPFNGSTTIRYSLPGANTSYHVLLKVFDATGREIKTLVNSEEAAGWKTISFDAGNLPAGIYFYRLSAGSFNEVRKLILVK